MSGATRRARQPRKPSESDGENTEERRRSSRLSSKPAISEKKVAKTSKRIPELDDEEKVEKSSLVDKRKLLMSPGTALAEEVGDLKISAQDQPGTSSSSSSKKKSSKNLKTHLTPPTQRTPEKKPRSPSPSPSGTPEKRAKKSEPSGALKGRIEEYDSLREWILESKESQSSLSIYISGQPGTGKTATTMRVLKSLRKEVKSCIVNCASTNTKTALFKTIFESLDFEGKPNVENFEGQVKRLKMPLVLVLDEIDHLANRKNAALYAAFQWPDTLSHKVIILGIANSIDLTERLLPKLMLVKPPKRLVFEPYTKEEIVEILNEKMEKDDASVDSKAIELTARKVAAMSGDLRTALHIFKQQKSHVMSSEDQPPGTPSGNGCREVLGIINRVYSSPLAKARLPLQPKVLLAVALTISANKKSTFDRNSLYRAYYKACDALRMPPLDDDDLHSAFQTLESQSFIRQLNGGKLVLQVDAPTAREAIKDSAMLEQIGLLQL